MRAIGEAEKIYTTAIEKFNADEMTDAIHLFALLCGFQPLKFLGLSALASTACAHHAYDHARALSKAALCHESGLPQTHFIAGYAAVKLEKIDEGKSHLVRAMQIGKQKPEWRDVVRATQKELLLIQFG